jgi:hypothetical protein
MGCRGKPLEVVVGVALMRMCEQVAGQAQLDWDAGREQRFLQITVCLPHEMNKRIQWRQGQ